jgi:hypothetical protein
MNSFSITRQDFNRLLTVVIWLFVVIAAIVMGVKYWVFHTSLQEGAISSVTTSVFLVTVGLGAISKKAWTSITLAKWFERPVVHGLWWGTLVSDYRKDGDQPIEPIPIAFVIRQRFFLLSIQSYTKDIPANSTMEFLMWNEKSSDALLKYVFEMTRRVNAENKTTTGYGELSLLDSGQRLLGYYFTDSPTQGRAELKLLQRDVDSINSFKAAERRWQELENEQNALMHA